MVSSDQPAPNANAQAVAATTGGPGSAELDGHTDPELTQCVEAAGDDPEAKDACLPPERKPAEETSPAKAKISPPEQSPPAEHSPPVGEPNGFPQPPRGTRHPNRPVPDPPPMRHLNRPVPDPPPVRHPNRYGGQPAEGSGGRG